MHVGLRQLVTAASTIVVAMLLAISVPVSQLHTVGVQTQCCCPDPDHCKCPGHDEGQPSQPAMQPCHKTQREFVSPVLPAFVPPAIEIVVALEPVSFEPVFTHAAPHPQPAPRRPDAPS